VQFTCCGAEGPQDYKDSLWYNHTDHSEGGFVPASCCRALNEPKLYHCQLVAMEYIEPDDRRKTANFAKVALPLPLKTHVECCLRVNRAGNVHFTFARPRHPGGAHGGRAPANVHVQKIEKDQTKWQPCVLEVCTGRAECSR